MKRLILPLLLFIATTLFANPVTPEQARQVAENFWLAKTHEKCASVHVLPQTDFNQLYIFDINGGQGFVIVAAQDCAYPVLGYSLDSPATQEMGANIRFWLNQYEQEIAWFAGRDTPAETFIAATWNSLLDGSWSEPKAVTAVSPLLTTTWNQSPYYNSLCPTGTPAGCTAIAVAQVMKYWNHPVQGTGSHSYVHDTYGTLSADFGSTTYDWDNMPNAVNSSSSTTQKNAVATLCYHVGVAVNMDYAPSGSGAALVGNNGAQGALTTYFGYKNTLRGAYKNSYSDTAWVGMLERELDASRPIPYAGFDSQAGHAFVFDGYNSSHQFHVNWGWGGSYNGYFSMGALNPYGGGTGSNGSNTFNLSNQALLGVQPIADLRISRNNIVLHQDGTAASLTVYANTTVAAGWTATATAPWVTLSDTAGSGNGAVSHLLISADSNMTGADRFADITFVQDSDTCTVRIAQLACSDLCTLTVNMLDRYDDGWEGATLTLAKPNGLVYGTMTNRGRFDIQHFEVCPDTVLVSWSTGAHDGECSFFIDNGNDAVLYQHARGSALPNGLIATIPNPCDTVGAPGTAAPIRYALTGEPNIDGAGHIDGVGEGLRFGSSCTLKAVAADGYRFVKWADNVVTNPRSVTVLEDAQYNAVYATIGDDTLRYDNNVYNTALGVSGGFYWGIRFRSAELIGRPTLNAIAFYAVYGGSYTIIIREGLDNSNNPGDVLMQGNITVGSSQTGWVNVTLGDDGVAVSPNKSLWVCLYAPGISYPAAMTASWCGSDNGCMISSNGTSWRSLHDAHSRWNTWMIRAVAPFDASGITVSLSVSDTAAGRVWMTGSDTLTAVTGSCLYGQKVSYGAVANDGYQFVKWSDGVKYGTRAVYVTEPLDLEAIFKYTGSQGIADAAERELRAYVEGRRLNVVDAEGSALSLYDVMGRCLYQTRQYDGQPIPLPASGVYLLRAEGCAPQRVVVR